MTNTYSYPVRSVQVRKWCAAPLEPLEPLEHTAIANRFRLAGHQTLPEKTSCKHHTNSRQLQNGAAFAVRLSVRGVSLVVHLNAAPVHLPCTVQHPQVDRSAFCLSSAFILLSYCSHPARPDRFSDLGSSKQVKFAKNPFEI